MEITIDIAAVRRLIRDERARASAEIDSLGPVEALARSQVRHDERIASAADVRTLACDQGCSWCCHFTVDVRPAEVFRILDYMREHFSPEQQRRVRAETAANRLEVLPLNEVERMQRTAPCVFLDSGRCTIYPVRPQTCRNYHATDAAGCRQSFEQPDNLDIDPEFAPLVYQAGGAHVEAFSQAMQDAGYDVSAYELNIAITAAMEAPESRARFEAREQPFPDVLGEDVPAEFMEGDDER